MDPIKPSPALWRDLSFGTAGHDVAAWQAVLRLEPVPLGWKGGWPLRVDGQFGPITERATKAYQAVRKLPVTAIVDAATRLSIPSSLFVAPSPVVPPPGLSLPPIAFFQARDYRVAQRTKIDQIVIHSAETGEWHSTAEAIGHYFKRPLFTSSAHYGVDDDSICQYVRDKDVAWHAPGVNPTSLGIEQAGYAKQTRDEWLDPFGDRMLRLVGRLVASKAVEFHVPLVWLTPADLLAGRRGLCTHVDVTKAFQKGTHTDPGPNYPKDVVLAFAQAALAA